MAAPWFLLMSVWLPLSLAPVCQAQEAPPSGCGTDLASLYYNLCDLSAAWGIVLEALASFGAVTSFVLTIILVASLPFAQDPRKKSLVGTQAFFLLGTFGLFGLTFDFIVKRDFSTCASRRFLFGVLFGICFSCLVAHALTLNFLARRNHGLQGWVTFGVALLLALVEVIINAEWLLITLVRSNGPSQDPCTVANEDFVMALIFVMFLLLAAFATAWPALCGRYKHWRKHVVFILLTTSLSMIIWVVWIIMYLYGNQQRGGPAWDDPTLAIVLVANACVFVFFYIIPEVSHVTRPGPEQAYEDDMYPTRGVGYETILKEQKSQSMFVENKAFSMDEPASAKKPVSPYSGYNGQLVTSVFQPTEMALMHKGPSEGNYNVILPRASANSQMTSSTNSTLRAEDAYAAQSWHAAAQKDGKGVQAPSPYSKSRW
ncbi:G-protein coupled receptor family C group 5 member C [Terrapene carolina triunguis]|uniref:G protein-coupled receptor class C group 5 member C n=1 Tax=Terrapene triunguis TaxID=2587831 RepID=A0A674JU78_9SAUR|nr:G-protein coupled receptor family C group 5 member C [Terrapene carolina triunguis]XP_026510218.1 G-protein coupled receptor family C group 5 member C [Terrapene carolina triunguis]XP_026510219.1 G-protein coupled receptor family C group 5 member C [Terrapene carolina triunguis]